MTARWAFSTSAEDKRWDGSAAGRGSEPFSACAATCAESTKDGAGDALVIARSDLADIPTDKLTREDVKRFHAENHERPIVANRAALPVAA